jgi:hypothetical protein
MIIIVSLPLFDGRTGTGAGAGSRTSELTKGRVKGRYRVRERVGRSWDGHIIGSSLDFVDGCER